VKPTYFILEEDRALMRVLASILYDLSPQAEVLKAESIYEAQRMTGKKRPEVLVLDLPLDQAGLDLFSDVKTANPRARILLVTPGVLPSAFEQAVRMSSVHFLTKPFNRAQATNMLRWLVDPKAADAGDLFKVILEDLRLLDVIQLKSMAGATTLLELTGRLGQKGHLVFANGQICHASSPGMDGLEAFYDMVRWDGGQIVEKPAPDKRVTTIQKDFQELLLEAARMLDEIIRSRPAPAAEEKTTAPRVVHDGSLSGEQETAFLDIPKILVVDDSPLVLRYAEDVLAKNFPDYAIMTVESGQEGMNCVRTYRPDVILLDYVLPDFNGDAFCRALRKEDGLAAIPVVLFSGQIEDLGKVIRGQSNVVAGLSKPFTETQLVSVVREALKKAPEKSAGLPAGSAEA
jgi:CheY-like chemotaxis protein